MRYISTRGSAPILPFDEVVLAGLASDGGLYVPESIPPISTATMAHWATLSYPALAVEVMHPFMGDAFSREALTAMVDEAYGSFRHEAIAPLVQLSQRHFVLELFHGPTLAFKDFALQLLGRLLDRLLTQRDQHAVVLGATSGDTGSAAIAGCAHSSRMQSVILYPHGRVSDVQRRQMTTLGSSNVHPLALDGTFDDCQDIVKSLFGDAAFRSGIQLVAVNSINWARILAQVVYYFYAAFALGAPAKRISFSVPTGNFGDIFAGYIAMRMGLPIEKLIIASNRNDILARCVRSGDYSMAGVAASLSPSMDIEISSNFERLLFDLHGRDGALMAEKMQRFRSTKSLMLAPSAYADMLQHFDGHACDDATTLDTIRGIHQACGYTLDPHTAVGVAASEALMPRLHGSVVTLATAHPAKFPDAVVKATGIHPALPAHLSDLMTREETIIRIANDADAVKSYLMGLV
ncbi:MAG: threonine synthase [Alphaproteobacteria bacterium]|nr:threonine synthase [Alphaproteobacteria bacterium]